MTNNLYAAYWELCKPRVVALMLLTAMVGMYLATPNSVPLSILLFGTLGIGLSASAAAVINHVVDQHIDAKMGRTKRRPLPSGQILPKHALYFATILGGIGLSTLIIFINTITAVMTFFTLVGYAVVYTMFLKHATPQNIVIGGAAGAIPPLLGWIAVTGSIDPQAWLLVLIIFVWTPPHFWALAIYRYEDYSKAKIPMLPVTHGIAFTKLCITLYTVLLLAVSVLPYVFGMSGWIYLISAIILGLIFIYYAVRLQKSDSNRGAHKTFKFSIIYLMLLFSVLLFDHYLAIYGV